MTISQYNEHPGISASAIKQGRASMMQMRHAMITPRDSGSTSPAMRWGTLAHRALLEPAAFAGSVAVWRGGRKAGREWAAFVTEADGMDIVTPDELERLEAMQAAARANKDARLFVSRIELAEFPIAWQSDHSGVGLCKARPDAVGTGFVGDYKTARDITPRYLFSQFHRLGYAHQLAWYRDALQTTRGESVNTVWILVQQSVAPYECGVIEMPPAVLDVAMGLTDSDNEDSCLAIARHYRACEAVGNWPGQWDGVTPYEPPAWATGEGDEVSMEGIEA